ncbi:hypothetical protein JG687_00018496 [Phytophthora cactorum]|uniref:Uncharacterized protein n=2 Tax=Phytophthora TaxID=4783 RepID=A0A329RIM2_9STRA|nr:hypothetical protein GQ600_16100 [Phytophthora cactorum]KAG3109846.1 hypothetical protein PI125_g10541 [Phytophthora idaei]KAG6943729.1 hypothetical protein JG688_00017460 [Phytophthora aleatoria]KAG2783402.1 hypothetical protein Pcac1_g6714 [Phytophthora cactorum]KAG2783466.1 hypothetical protein Pcac1_g6724 [Phytophthora cactorum]
MSWRGQPSDPAAVDGYEWISTFLKNYDGDLLEFELEVDSQHFFDNMDVLLGVQSPNDHRRSPLQLTPHVLSVISDLQDSSTKLDVQEAVPVPSISFCDLLKEAQAAAKRKLQLQASRSAVTTPRKAQARTLRHRTLMATAAATAASTKAYEKPVTRSSSRKKLNRRLF